MQPFSMSFPLMLQIVEMEFNIEWSEESSENDPQIIS